MNTHEDEHPALENATYDPDDNTIVAPTLYPTPKHVAEEMVALADIQDGHSVLEPSAGTGVLVQAIKAREGIKHLHITAIEIELKMYRALKQLATCVHCYDFLEWCPLNKWHSLSTDITNGWTYDGPGFDRIVMNPPFNKGADIKHIEHARQFLKGGGRLVAICAGGPRQRAMYGDYIEQELPAGTFEGTGVRSCIIVINR